MTDALGNEIVIGQLYGYSNRQNGIISVVLGHAEKINKNSVTLRVTKRGRSCYDNNIVGEDIGRPTISCGSNSIFPLQSDETLWIVNQAKDLLME